MPDIRLGARDAIVSKSHNVLHPKEHGRMEGSVMLGTDAALLASHAHAGSQKDHAS